jgi:hypothetical protein
MRPQTSPEHRFVARSRALAATASIQFGVHHSGPRLVNSSSPIPIRSAMNHVTSTVRASWPSRMVHFLPRVLRAPAPLDARGPP